VFGWVPGEPHMYVLPRGSISPPMCIFHQLFPTSADLYGTHLPQVIKGSCLCCSTDPSKRFQAWAALWPWLSEGSIKIVNLQFFEFCCYCL
jgi:hypothetical protein